MVGHPCVPSAGITPPSSLIRAHTPVLNPPTASGFNLVRWVFAGYRQSLLRVGPSRRYLCESFPGCLAPYPGCSCGALARSFPQDIGLPDVMTRSALGNTHTMATSVWTLFRGCSHSLMFKPADLLATQVAPTAVPLGTGQPWLFLPRLFRFVTSPNSGYANRPSRATDGRGTSTLQDSQPCQLLPRRYLCNLSLDAWPPTPVSSVVRLLVSSHRTSAFPPLGQGRLHTNTIRTATSVRYAFSRLQAFSNVHASRFARHPGRSYRCAITDTQGSRDFYVRAEHGSLPSRASDILAA